MASFSVIIPTYNRAYIIGNAIESVRAQDVSCDWEVLVIDDGSTDGTEALIAGFGDPRINYHRQSNRGPSAARNRGLREATKNWIVYLDSDNTLYPSYFRIVAQELATHQSALYAMARQHKTFELYEGGVLVKSRKDKDNELKELTLQDLFHRKAFFDTNGFVHARSIVTPEIAWDESIRGIEDWDFLMQLGRTYPEHFLYIATPLVDYRMRLGADEDGIIATSRYSEWADMFEYVYNKHRADPLMPGQQWYPARVEHYRKLQEELDAGRVGAPYTRFFG